MRDILYLAGLLHDIDRFWVNGTVDFFWDFKENFPTELPLEGDNGLINLVVNYKAPQTVEQGFVRMADTWTSGFDRISKSKNQTNQEKQALSKIFKRLNILDVDNRPNDTSNVESAYYPIESLSLRSDILNKNTAVFDESKLLELNKNFAEEFILLPKSDLKAFNYSLHYLLRKYTWCIPAYEGETDISLFEHLKLTASITLSLYDYYLNNPDSFEFRNNLLSIKQSRRPLMLWCIDISGIQKFIYNISSKYASKSLKGRSFYLQYILDRLTDYIIQETESTQSHVVYSSGGKFFLILPQTAKIKTKMDEIEKNVQQYLWNNFKDSFYVCFGKVEWSWKDNTYSTEGVENLSNLWMEASRNASQQKSQKFKDTLLLSDNFNELFNGEMDEGGQKDICMVSGVEINELQRVKGEKIKISKEILKQIELGDELKQLRWINKEPINSIAEIFDVLINEKPAAHSFQNFVSDSEHIQFLRNQTNIGSGFQFYGGSEMAVLNEKIKNFEELTGIIRENPDDDKSNIDKSKSTGNFNRLGILRMDVDNLGKIFTHGFAKEQASFSAFATLSTSLDWFFSGYLNTIRRNVEYKDWLNIIYSGGDDVFAVGRWDKIISFAERVQLDFKRFTGRTDITISAGISIVTPKFPIAKAADMAGEAESEAKDFTRNNGSTKNAISLFDIAVGWEEFEAVKAIKDFWISNLSGAKPILSKGILQKMFEFYRVFDEREKADNSKRKGDISWIWNALYTLKRHEMKDNYPRNTALKTISTFILCNQFEKRTNVRFEAFIVACRWAELELKDNNN